MIDCMPQSANFNKQAGMRCIAQGIDTLVVSQCSAFAVCSIRHGHIAFKDGAVTPQHCR